MKADLVLNLSGLFCPMPLLKTKKALNDLQVGQIICVISTDPQAVEDFKAFSKQTSNTLLDVKMDDKVFRFLIQKGKPPLSS